MFTQKGLHPTYGTAYGIGTLIYTCPNSGVTVYQHYHQNTPLYYTWDLWSGDPAQSPDCERLDCCYESATKPNPTPEEFARKTVKKYAKYYRTKKAYYEKLIQNQKSNHDMLQSLEKSMGL